MHLYKNQSSLITEVADKSPEGYSCYKCSWDHHIVTVSWPTVFWWQTQSQTCIHRQTLKRTLTCGTVHWTEQKRCLSITRWLHDDWLVPLSAPTPSVGGRRSLHQYSFFPLSSIFMSSFIFITGYTEQIRKLCVHFCRSSFEMKRWRTALVSLTLLGDHRFPWLYRTFLFLIQTSHISSTSHWLLYIKTLY